MTIYVLAPQNHTSGGPELSHQLCNAINRLTDVPCLMCYVDINAPFEKALGIDVPAPAAYEIYETDHVANADELDSPDSVIIFPEGLTLSMPYYPQAKKVLWWMSVDNYVVSTKESNMPFIKDNVCLHLYQSYYAKDYVEKKIPGANGLYLSDYINQEHGKFIYPAKFRENIGLYNPAKGYDQIKPLVEKANWLKWVPLTGLDVPHMVLMMEAGKVYVDFGNHPGKDRIPREAAADGCCVITNKKGAAAFEGDVPIPEKYKFDNPVENLDKIDALLHDICDNFAQHQTKFENYRKMIAGEKAKFDEDVMSFIQHLLQL
ncbi:MAG: hypothetical protein IJI01_08430 [Butyrivibrio sp.]|uniref:hypothetical protein n=1 Tax=Butyrivibrio sp. TaxID=28121 RepID=UPI0025BD8C36|nr:hypothetical protein [Butyrivibrio sp.]MBQ6588690.1 hypothetical protein [Butyrivibrio sp.]